MTDRKNKLLQIILWIIQGAFIGVGAILPGISGGTLCYAFGIYHPILEVLSNPIQGIKKHWFKLGFLLLGCAVGFVGLSGAVAYLLNWNESIVLCVFVGLIIGTLPEIWHDSGEHGRNKFAYISLIISFIMITVLFFMLKNYWRITMQPNLFGWVISGLLWGLSFIIPGFSSSTLLLFFGIYEKMSEGISKLDFSVIIPLGITMLATLLLLSRIMKWVFDKFHSIASHCVLGFVLATTIMILPSFRVSALNIAIYLCCIASGTVISYFFTRLCAKMKEKTTACEVSVNLKRN